MDETRGVETDLVKVKVFLFRFLEIEHQCTIAIFQSGSFPGLPIFSVWMNIYRAIPSLKKSEELSRDSIF